MECKSITGMRTAVVNKELIDTLWNVNEDKEWYLEMQSLELIDTLWNVNCYYVLDSVQKWQN